MKIKVENRDDQGSYEVELPSVEYLNKYCRARRLLDKAKHKKEKEDRVHKIDKSK